MAGMCVERGPQSVGTRAGAALTTRKESRSWAPQPPSISVPASLQGNGGLLAVAGPTTPGDQAGLGGVGGGHGSRGTGSEVCAPFLPKLCTIPCAHPPGACSAPGVSGLEERLWGVGI